MIRLSAYARALSSSRMSRSTPMALIAFPSVSRSADAFSVVGITSPVAARGFRQALRVTPRSTTSGGGRELARLLLADEAGERLLDHLVAAEQAARRPRSPRGSSPRGRRRTPGPRVFDQPLCMYARALSSSRMSRRIPMAPITLPSASRSAEAFRLVGITSQSRRCADSAPRRA